MTEEDLKKINQGKYTIDVDPVGSPKELEVHYSIEDDPYRPPNSLIIFPLLIAALFGGLIALLVAFLLGPLF